MAMQVQEEKEKEMTPHLKRLIKQLVQKAGDIVELWQQIKLEGKREGFTLDELELIARREIRHSLVRLGFTNSTINSRLNRLFFRQDEVGEFSIERVEQIRQKTRHYIVISHSSWNKLNKIGAENNETPAEIIERLVKSLK